MLNTASENQKVARLILNLPVSNLITHLEKNRSAEYRHRGTLLYDNSTTSQFVKAWGSAEWKRTLATSTWKTITEVDKFRWIRELVRKTRCFIQICAGSILTKIWQYLMRKIYFYDRWSAFTFYCKTLHYLYHWYPYRFLFLGIMRDLRAIQKLCRPLIHVNIQRTDSQCHLNITDRTFYSWSNSNSWNVPVIILG